MKTECNKRTSYKSNYQNIQTYTQSLLDKILFALQKLDIDKNKTSQNFSISWFSPSRLPLYLTVIRVTLIPV